MHSLTISDDKIKILILEHDQNDIDLMHYQLKKDGINYVSAIAHEREEYQNALQNFSPDVILSDYAFPSFDGLTAFDIKQKISPDALFIFVSGALGEETNIELIKKGIDNFVSKDRLFTLSTNILRGLKESRERKEKVIAEKNLIKNEKRLLQAQAIAHVGSWELNFETGTAVWSDEACRIYGIPIEESTQQTFNSWRSFIHPEDLDHVKREIERSHETLSDSSFEHRIVRKDGTVRYIHSVSKFEFNKNGEPIGLIGVCHDITERKKAEHDLNESEQIMRTFVDESLLAIYFIDPQTKKIIYSNSALSQLLGYSQEEFGSMEIYDFINHSKENIDERIAEAKTKKKIITGERQWKRKDNEIVYVLVSSFYQKRDGTESIYVAALDITERKKSEQQLNKTLHRLTQAQAVAHVGSWELNFVTGTAIWSDEACRMYGIPLEDKAKQTFNTWISFIHPEDLDAVKKELEKSQPTLSDFSFEHRILWKDGTVRYIHSISKFEFNNEGKPLGLIGICHDITERKKAEEKLVAANKELSTLFDSIDESFFSTDIVNRRVIQISSACEKIYGYPKQKFLDDPDLWMKVIHPDDRYLLKGEFIKIAKGETVRMENRIIRSDNEIRWIERKAIPTLSQNGKLIRVDGVVKDITDKKNAEQKLKELSQRLLLASDSAKIGIFDWDLVSNKLIWDHNMYVLYGVSPADSSRPIEISEKAIHPDDKAQVGAEVKAALNGTKQFHTTYRIVLSNKEVRYTETHAIILRNDKGQPLRMIGVNWDITKQKTAEEKIMQSEIQIRNFAKHLNQIQEEERAHLAREIHDELGQQLVGIKIGISSFKKKNSTPDEKENVKEMMDVVDNALQSLREIATKLRPGILDTLGLVPSIEWLGKEFERKTGAKCEIKMSVREQKFEKDLSICFFRICQEALTNISKHSKADRIKILILQNKKELILKVEDNGKGISGEKLKNPFSMGLLGMHERANNIGGSLQITTNKGRGTIVELKATIN